MSEKQIRNLKMAGICPATVQASIKRAISGSLVVMMM